MAKITLTKKGYKCERCKHEWIPKGKKKPITCPNCKSPYWDTPRKKEREEFCERASKLKINSKKLI